LVVDERRCNMHAREYDEGTKAVTVPEAARILGIGEWTLRNRIKDGTVPAFKIGKLVRVTRKELDRIMEGNGYGRTKITITG
jgi:excisionase family DNA binding protein